ncbi:hypothetical protein HHK36_006525 [Tetracentron sinense]|uniref:GAG-pre-integrase domain-containing protein n=1 Tax=Tetracentron sinense TaxID=13715 RepID=A0A834ZHN5_TETSI|nr:hypothetical protein HHK36_006525 [Tetracentron sinense]
MHGSDKPSTTLFTNSASQARSQGRSTYQGRSDNYRGRGRGHYGGGRGNSPQAAQPHQSPTAKPNSNNTCQICNRVGHNALDCFHRLDLSYQGRQPPQKLQAMVASKQASSTWYTDTRATNHVTADLSNLSLHSEYDGPDSVAIANGKTLPISHVGTTKLSHNNNLFHLDHILHVPHMKTNLISVSQFTKDNNCHFIFTDSDFFVKDNSTGRTLFQGRIRDGIYPIQLPLSASHSPSAFNTVRLSSSIWHHRLGHLAPPIMASLSKELSLSGSSKLSSICSSCQMGKSSRLPFSMSESVTNFPLELVHTDVWGPTLELSINGYKFYVGEQNVQPNLIPPVESTAHGEPSSCPQHHHVMLAHLQDYVVIDDNVTSNEDIVNFALFADCIIVTYEDVICDDSVSLLGIHSDWSGDMENRKSTSSYAFHIGSIIFSWSSKEQQVVALSTTEGNTL